MLSLENAFAEADIAEFVDRVRRFLNLAADAPLAFTAEPKIDGLSLVAALRGAAASSQAATRGDGETGENVTAERPHHRRHPRTARRRPRRARGPRRGLHVATPTSRR